MRRAGRSAAIPLLLAAALALAANQSAAQQKKEDLPHPKTVEELQKAMKAVLDKEHVPGAGVALVANGQLLWCGGIGKADVASSREMTCDTEFRVGSISKTFVALALLKLQEEGKINLYARLQDVAPEVPFKNRWEATQPVRVVNLLEHTAGFDDMEFSEVYNLKDRYDFPLLDVFKRFQKPQVTRWPPGTRMSYSNPGNAIAGYLIEKAAGQPFDQYIRETLLRPLGMEKADFPFTDAEREKRASARLRPGELLERSRRSRHAWPRRRNRRIHLLVSIYAGAQLGLRRASEQHEFGPRSGRLEPPGNRFSFKRFSQTAAAGNQPLFK
jgi:CubicO group peptidase (beta-lactamase class C family)